jgi:hypothetical protein
MLAVSRVLVVSPTAQGGRPRAAVSLQEEAMTRGRVGPREALRAVRPALEASKATPGVAGMMAGATTRAARATVRALVVQPGRERPF